MKKTCENCAAWQKTTAHFGECRRLSPDNKERAGGNENYPFKWRVTTVDPELSHGSGIPRVDWCTQWTPREIGTCGECRWWIHDKDVVGCIIGTCRKNAICHDRWHDASHGCGDWEPK